MNLMGEKVFKKTVTVCLTGTLMASSATATEAKSLINNGEITVTNSIKSMNVANRYRLLFDELNTYKDLKDNWDGYGALKPLEENIATSYKFLRILELNNIEAPNIMPSGEGEISLFWKNKEHYLELCFDIKDYFSFFYKSKDIIYGEDDLFVDSSIPSIINEYLSKITKDTATNKQNLHSVNNAKLMTNGVSIV